jgi:hypothetical protein
MSVLLVAGSNTSTPNRCAPARRGEGRFLTTLRVGRWRDPQRHRSTAERAAVAASCSRFASA